MEHILNPGTQTRYQSLFPNIFGCFTSQQSAATSSSRVLPRLAIERAQRFRQERDSGKRSITVTSLGKPKVVVMCPDTAARVLQQFEVFDGKASEAHCKASGPCSSRRLPVRFHVEKPQKASPDFNASLTNSNGLTWRRQRPLVAHALGSLGRGDGLALQERAAAWARAESVRFVFAQQGAIHCHSLQPTTTGHSRQPSAFLVDVRALARHVSLGAIAHAVVGAKDENNNSAYGGGSRVPQTHWSSVEGNVPPKQQASAGVEKENDHPAAVKTALFRMFALSMDLEREDKGAREALRSAVKDCFSEAQELRRLERLRNRQGGSGGRCVGAAACDSSPPPLPPLPQPTLFTPTLLQRLLSHTELDEGSDSNEGARHHHHGEDDDDDEEVSDFQDRRRCCFSRTRKPHRRRESASRATLAPSVLTLEEVCANTHSALHAGCQTLAGLLCCALLRLAERPDLQDRLAQEAAAADAAAIAADADAEEAGAAEAVVAAGVGGTGAGAEASAETGTDQFGAWGEEEQEEQGQQQTSATADGRRGPSNARNSSATGRGKGTGGAGPELRRSGRRRKKMGALMAAVLNETLRCHPPVSGLPRVVRATTDRAPVGGGEGEEGGGVKPCAGPPPLGIPLAALTRVQSSGSNEESGGGGSGRHGGESGEDCKTTTGDGDDDEDHNDNDSPTVLPVDAEFHVDLLAAAHGCPLKRRRRQQQRGPIQQASGAAHRCRPLYASVKSETAASAVASCEGLLEGHIGNGGDGSAQWLRETELDVLSHSDNPLGAFVAPTSKLPPEDTKLARDLPTHPPPPLPLPLRSNETIISEAVVVVDDEREDEERDGSGVIEEKEEGEEDEEDDSWEWDPDAVPPVAGGSGACPWGIGARRCPAGGLSLALTAAALEGLLLCGTPPPPLGEHCRRSHHHHHHHQEEEVEVVEEEKSCPRVGASSPSPVRGKKLCSEEEEKEDDTRGGERALGLRGGGRGLRWRLANPEVFACGAGAHLPTPHRGWLASVVYRPTITFPVPVTLVFEWR